MGITTKLAQDLFSITLHENDKDRLRTLIIDFFAAAYAGRQQNKDFNQTVEKVVYSQAGIEESKRGHVRKTDNGIIGGI